MSTPSGWADARAAAAAAPTALSAESVLLREAIGRTLVADAIALIDVPHYASSAMDGWAVAGHPPWRLRRRRDALVAGASIRLEDGAAVPIVTGGLVPEGARAVLRSESGIVSPNGSMLEPGPDARAGEPFDGMHVRPTAEEAVAGEAVIQAGTLLNPTHIAVAAVCGHDTLQVAARPAVGFVYTGDEVVTAGIPARGYVRDTFGPQLPALAGMLGARAVETHRVPDRLERLADAIDAAAASAQIVVTTGGTGHSSVDHLQDALRMRGARIIIPCVAMRPGGPSLLADLGGGRWLVGLPGNPLAAMMGVFTLLQSLIRGMQGMAVDPLGTVTIDETIPATPGRTRLLPFRRMNGVARPAPWNAAGMLRGLASSDGVLVCPPHGVERGATVDTLRLPWWTP